MAGVRIRGIYATALTVMLEDVVQASAVIDERVDQSIPLAPADVQIETTANRQGVGIHGPVDAVEPVADRLAGVGRDTLTWSAPLAQDSVYAGEVTETRGSGALVKCGPGTGFLPYSKTDVYIDEGDCLRVQVAGAKPPWRDRQPILDTAIRIRGGLASLVRGGSPAGNGPQTSPELAEILPTDPPAGWRVAWRSRADDADLDALDGVLSTLSDRAESLEAALAAADPPSKSAPHTEWDDPVTRWVWFGRESRFTLDDRRREVAPTMPGHHRIKAGADGASDAVDFVESVCGPFDGGDGEFPFEAVRDQWGPAVGDEIDIGHGKPDGRRIELGPAEVTAVEGPQVTVEREMVGRGTYDGIGTEREPGDIATTTVREGRWWYQTVYRSPQGDRRGTYVNICTPVEIFPDELRYVDLHVDVVRQPDGTIQRVDEDELTAAVDEGHLSEALADRARQVASGVESALDS